MATITVRRIDPATGEPVMGQGLAAFITDITAVAQIVGTKLKLLQGEWWENTSLGVPLFGFILGAGGGTRQMAASSLVLQQQIESAPYVTDILSASVNGSTAARSFAFSASASTSFGVIVVNKLPGNRAAVQTTN